MRSISASSKMKTKREGVTMKNFGLTDKRYAQLQSIGYNDDDIQEIVEG